MSYAVGGKQYVAVASGSDLFSFAPGALSKLYLGGMNGRWR